MVSQIEKRTIAISSLLPGKVYQSLGDTSFVIARKAGEGFEIEIGRVVPESYSDDFMSHTGRQRLKRPAMDSHARPGEEGQKEDRDGHHNLHPDRASLGDLVVAVPRGAENGENR